jgi:hypothetical protein
LKLIDTDVLIWAGRGNLEAQLMLDSTAEKAVSVVTLMEMMQGMRNKRELQAFEKYIVAQSIVTLTIDPDISNQAVALVQRYSLSHHMQMADALLAATALIQNITLVSANTKHYQFVPKLNLESLIVR